MSFTLPLVGILRSWQAVFLIVDDPGLLLAFLIFTLPELIRRGPRTQSASLSWRRSYGDLLTFMASRRRFFVCHYVVEAERWHAWRHGRATSDSPQKSPGTAAANLLVSPATDMAVGIRGPPINPRQPRVDQGFLGCPKLHNERTQA